MRVRVERILQRAGSVWVAEGAVLVEPKVVQFAGDWRPMLDVMEALVRGDEVIAEVEDWQVLKMTRAEESDDHRE
jgi:hypothetical protein